MSQPGQASVLSEALIDRVALKIFNRAQGVYREQHDHFPLKNTWEALPDPIRDGWRSMAKVALEAVRTEAPAIQAGDVEAIALKLCEARGENPDGQQVRFVDGDAHSVSFLNLAKRDVEVVLEALRPVPPAGDVGAILAELVRIGQSVQTDMETAHKLRGDGASSFMREDDRDRRRDFSALLEQAKAALSAVPPAEGAKIEGHDRHPYAQPGDEPHQVWMLRFSDPDLRTMIWTDENARRDAIAAWNRYSPSYNCYLFSTLDRAALSPLPAEPQGSVTKDASTLPPPHWPREPASDRHPASVEAWDWRADTPHGPERSRLRLNFAADLADPRAPDQMALVLRVDLMRVIGQLEHRTAQSEARGRRIEELTAHPQPRELRSLTREGVAKKLAELKGHKRLDAEIVLDSGKAAPVWQCYLGDADAILSLAGEGGGAAIDDEVFRLLRKVGDFIDDEESSREEAGSHMSDYQNEATDAKNDLDSAIAILRRAAMLAASPKATEGGE